MNKRPKLEKLQPASSSQLPPIETFKRPNFKLSLNDWTSLKILALERHCSLQSLLLEAIHDLLRKYHRDP